MELKDIYNGLPVKTDKFDGLLEVVRVDDVSESIYCRPTNSVENGLKEMKAEDLRECRRG